MSRLTFSRDTNGNHIATIDGFYHSSGVTKDQAVRRLMHFLRTEHANEWAKSRPVLEEHFSPKEQAND